MRALLLAAALAPPLAVSAQTTPADVWPLVPGNAWTYTSFYQYSSPTGGGESRPDGAVTWTVLDSVQAAAGRLPRVDFGGDECLVQAQQTDGVVSFLLLAVSGDAPCAARPVPTLDGPGFSVPTVTEGTEFVEVGGEIIIAPRVRRGGEETGTSVSTEVGRRTADGVGITAFYTRGHATGTSNTSRSTTLRQVILHGHNGGWPVGQSLETRTDFWPLIAGNRWEFRITDGAGASLGEVAWTIQLARPGVTLLMQHVNDGAFISAATCPLSLVEASPATTWQTRFSLAECVLPDPVLAPALAGTAATLGVDVYTSAERVRIGDQMVQADVADGFNTLGGGANGPTAETSYRLALSIGPVSYSSYSRIGTPGRWNAALAYARVGGVTYGQELVAGEGNPDAAAVAFTAGPNPTRGALALSFALPEAADAAAEVVDALGRSALHADLGAQAAGVGTARLDLSRLAPGVYVVRLVAGSVQASTRISIVR